MLDRPFPSSWTVRRARDAYLEENGFTVALAAWRASGNGPTSLFAMGGATAEYEALLDVTVGELRTRLGLPLDGLVTSGALHARAPRHELPASGSL